MFSIASLPRTFNITLMGFYFWNEFMPDTICLSTHRKLMRAKRRTLTARQRHQAARSAMRQLVKLDDLLPRSAKIGIYLAEFGELPTEVIVRFCQRRGHQVYLPVTRAACPLRFAPITGQFDQTALKKHPLGMYEPVTKPLLAAAQMDAIICPLVAVDMTGVRLGMGGGYYDRTFARTPHCLKVAWCYDFQIVPSLPSQPWDMAVDVIISDRRFIRL